MRKHLFLYLFFCCALLAACRAPAQSDSRGDRLQVVATTTLVGDVVRQVGGERIELSVLLPVGVDPHSFDPSPQDMARLANADLIFANGVGLEAFLERTLANAGGQAELVEVSQGITLLDSEAHPGEPAEAHTGGDPHVWFDPNLVKVWVENVRAALTSHDPDGAAVFQANADAALQQLAGLDAWIQEQVAQIPLENRKLVTDHTSFTYFAARYGFTQVGAVIPGYSSLAQPSAQDLANLEDLIRSQGVRAVFVSESANPTLEQRLAGDSGVSLVRLFNGSLSAADGPAATYLDFMRYNVTAIVEALR